MLFAAFGMIVLSVSFHFFCFGLIWLVHLVESFCIFIDSYLVVDLFVAG